MMVLLRIAFEMLNLVPMPFQLGLFLFCASIILYLGLRMLKFIVVLLGKIGMTLTEWLIHILLLPEYLWTNLLRLIKVRYIPGAQSYDAFVEWIGSFLHKSFEKTTHIQNRDIRYPSTWVFIIIILVIGAWFLVLMPQMQDTLTSTYIHKFFSWYSDLQYFALAYQEK